MCVPRQKRDCAAIGGGIEVQNMEQSTRQTFGVPSRGVLIESSDKVVRLSEARYAYETRLWERAAIRGEGGQSARGISRGVAGDPRLRGERKPTCSPLVTSFASAISYGKFARGAGWWSGSGRALGLERTAMKSSAPAGAAR